MFSSFQFDIKGAADVGTMSGRVCDCGAFLDNSGVVHQTVKTTGRLSSSTTICSHPLSGVQHPLLSKMKLIACSLSGKPWRTEAFVKTLQTSTCQDGQREKKKCYHSYIKKWITHCDERSKDPFRPTADELIVFLTSLYNQGKGCSCINLARSAVATLSLGSKISVGMHLLVK